MSCFHIPKALPSLSSSSSSSYQSNHHHHHHHHHHHNHSLSISSSQHKQSHHNKQAAPSSTTNSTTLQHSRPKLFGFAVQVGGVLAAAAVAHPAFAVTGVNDEEDLLWVLVQLGIAAFLYFLVVPPFIMNWLRTRWYKRNLLEMYLQFMFVFMFYPGVLLWAPFLNFRKFPRDPSMKYPWSTPENPSQIKGGFLKYPWAQPQDYE